MRVRALVKSVFFGNYFYGICAVGLAIEATLQQRYPLANPWFYVALFTLTTWYYTIAYITEQTQVTENERTNWYIHNRKFVNASQWILQLIFISLVISFVSNHYQRLLHLPFDQLFLLIIFPLAAIAYYGVNYKVIRSFNLRNIGWMKPFIIGFTWAGLVTVYPILFHKITHNESGTLVFIGGLLFLKNFMFVTVLCIMFDIKDYAMDYNRHLKTFVVKNGLRNTIFYILIPLSLAGWGSFLLYGMTHHFSGMKIFLNTIPFLSMIAVAYSLSRRKSILYYLILIDGLMLLKAICGSVAMVWF